MFSANASSRVVPAAAAAVLGAAALLTLSGCAILTGAPERPAAAADTAVLSRLGGDAAVAAYDAATTPAERMARRNDILLSRVYAVDVSYHAFAARLARDGARTALAGDWAQLGLASGAATGAGTAVRANLSALGLLVGGLRQSADRDLLGQASLPALLAAMEAQRKVVLAQLTGHMALDAADYPLARGLIDVETYRQAGTLSGALSQAIVDAGAKGAAADGRIAASFTAHFTTDDATTRLRAVWKDPDGAIRPAGAAELQAWMAANGLAGADITSLLYADSLAAQRAKAVHDLGL